MATDWCLDSEVQTAMLLFNADRRSVDINPFQVQIHFGKHSTINFSSKDDLLQATEGLYGPKKSWGEQILRLEKSNPVSANSMHDTPTTWYLRDICSILLVYMYYLSYTRIWCGPQDASDLSSWLKLDCSWQIFNGAKDTLLERGLICRHYGDDGSDGITAPRPDRFEIVREAIFYLDRRFEENSISPLKIGEEIDRRNHRPREFYKVLCIGIFS